jgi:formiminotetrahydrofolate cyclodeaminase
VKKLVDLSVHEFVEAVASADEPVPAGGSVSALTGAASAALLALVCAVTERRTSSSAAKPLFALRELREKLLHLVDDDAIAYRAWMGSGRDSAERQEASARAAAVPLDIARACLAVLELTEVLDPEVHGATRMDLATARALASAAATSAAAIAEHNLTFVGDASQRRVLQDEIRRLGPPAEAHGT